MFFLTLCDVIFFTHVCPLGANADSINSLHDTKQQNHQFAQFLRELDFNIHNLDMVLDPDEDGRTQWVASRNSKLCGRKPSNVNEKQEEATDVGTLSGGNHHL